MSVQPLNNLKDAITRNLGLIATALDVFNALDSPTNFDKSILQDKVTRIINQFQVLENKFIEINLNNTQHKAYEEAIAKLQGEIECSTAQVQSAIRNRATAAATTGGTTEAAARYKVIKANKPFLLSTEHTLAEFRVWSKAFIAYHRTSHMELIKVKDQQIHLRQCLNPKLQAQLQAKITDTTPIFAAHNDEQNDDQNCLDILKAIFVERKPLLSRNINMPKIEWPLSKTSCNAKDNVPKQFAFVEPKTLGSTCLFLKKNMIRGAVALITIIGMAIVATVTLHGDLSKSHNFFFSMLWQKCKNLIVTQ